VILVGGVKTALGAAATFWNRKARQTKIGTVTLNSKGILRMASLLGNYFGKPPSVAY